MNRSQIRAQVPESSECCILFLSAFSTLKAETRNVISVHYGDNETCLYTVIFGLSFIKVKLLKVHARNLFKAMQLIYKYIIMRRTFNSVSKLRSSCKTEGWVRIPAESDLNR